MGFRSIGIFGFLAGLFLVMSPPSVASGQLSGPAPELTGLIGRGIEQRRSGLYEESIQTLQQALALAKRTSDVDGEWQARTFLALTYEVKGDLKQALKLHEENRAFAVRHRQQLIGEVMNRESDSLRAISAIHTLLGNPAAAAGVLKQDPAYAGRGKQPDLGHAKLLQRIGINLFLAGKTQEAVKTLSVSLAEFEADFDWRQKGAPGFWGYESQVELIRWLEAARIAEGKTDEALELTERGRARDFTAVLASRRAPETGPSGDKSTPNIGRIKQIATAQRTTLVVYSVLYTYDPSLPMEFSRFDQLPARDLFIWVIQPTGNIVFRSVKLTPRPESLVDLVRDARASIGVRSSGDTPGPAGSDSGQRPAYRHLRRLYDLLIGPIADLLPADPTHRVTFVPQDVLFLVPFAALQDGHGIHLVERHSIATTPSVRALELVTQPANGTRDDATGVLIVGNPKMPRIRRSPDGPQEILNSLPGTEKEAIAVARLLKSPAVIGEQATKANILPRMPAAGIVHLATHGLLDEADGNFNALALAPDAHEAGLLTAREVRALRLKADLIVLSACDTARGKISGDGIDGFSRSFLAAGARSLVVSLWQVADAATVALMISFYEGLQKGLDKAQALRQAMLTTRSQYPDPRRWSAFTLVGSADVSAGLRALLRGERVTERPEGDDRGPAGQGLYRYFVFPLPDGARLHSEYASPDGSHVSAFFNTDLSAAALIVFFRRELTRRGLHEDVRLARNDGRDFQLVFDGLPNGKVVVQGKGSDSVSLRVEPRRR